MISVQDKELDYAAEELMRVIECELVRLDIRTYRGRSANRNNLALIQ